MTVETAAIIAEFKRYERELSRLLSRFKRTDRSIHIGEGDDPRLRQIGREVVDLLDDSLGQNSYSTQIVHELNQDVSNYLSSPSYKSVENVISVLRAAITRMERNPEILERRQSAITRLRQNLFIIHGHDEAKWRELKDVIQNDFRLNPIVLQEQPDAGCRTVIEKFENYAATSSYAIAIFTPDDEVASGDVTYLQARPNVIYELGWFCGRLGRSGVMLVLKEGTTMFSDFGGIIQKRFKQNVREQVSEIRKDLVAAGILQVT